MRLADATRIAVATAEGETLRPVNSLCLHWHPHPRDANEKELGA
jgi:hypothetical protein